MVVAFEVRLVAVGGQDLGIAEHAIVIDEREAAVADGIVTVNDLVPGPGHEAVGAGV